MQEWAKLHQTQPTAKMTVAWAIGKYLTSDAYQSLGTGTQADLALSADQFMRLRQ